MTTNEKEPIIEAWNKHITKNGRRHEIACFSSIREDDFRVMFRKGILSHAKLSQKEKQELLEYTGLTAEPPEEENRL